MGHETQETTPPEIPVKPLTAGASDAYRLGYADGIEAVRERLSEDFNKRAATIRAEGFAEGITAGQRFLLARIEQLARSEIEEASAADQRAREAIEVMTGEPPDDRESKRQVTEATRGECDRFNRMYGEGEYVCVIDEVTRLPRRARIDGRAIPSEGGREALVYLEFDAITPGTREFANVPVGRVIKTWAATGLAGKTAGPTNPEPLGDHFSADPRKWNGSRGSADEQRDDPLRSSGRITEVEEATAIETHEPSGQTGDADRTAEQDRVAYEAGKAAGRQDEQRRRIAENSEHIRQMPALLKARREAAGRGPPWRPEGGWPVPAGESEADPVREPASMRTGEEMAKALPAPHTGATTPHGWFGRLRRGAARRWERYLAGAFWRVR